MFHDRLTDSRSLSPVAADPSERHTLSKVADAGRLNQDSVENFSRSLEKKGTQFNRFHLFDP